MWYFRSQRLNTSAGCNSYYNIAFVDAFIERTLFRFLYDILFESESSVTIYQLVV